METLWTILIWVAFGLVVGALARLLVPGRDPIGMAGTILLGVVGSLVGGFVWWLLEGTMEPFAPGGFLLALGGAILALLLYNAAVRRPGRV